MANIFVPCASCQRHISLAESDCPFCGNVVDEAELTTRAVPGPSRRLSRAAIFVFGATVALAACGDDTSEDDGQTSMSGGNMGGQGGVAGDNGSVGGMYGAPGGFGPFGGYGGTDEGGGGSGGGVGGGGGTGGAGGGQGGN